MNGFLRHSNSRISQIIKQYNQAIDKTNEHSGDHVMAPPPDSMAEDEDWILQKTLETKRKVRLCYFFADLANEKVLGL